MEVWYPLALLCLQTNVDGKLWIWANSTFHKVFCITHRPAVFRANQCAVGFLNHLIYDRLPWTSTPNQSVKVATSFDSRNLFHFVTTSYPPLPPVIAETLGQLTYQGSTRSTLRHIRENGSTNIQLSSWSLKYPSFFRLLDTFQCNRSLVAASSWTVAAPLDFSDHRHLVGQ